MFVNSRQYTILFHVIEKSVKKKWPTPTKISLQSCSILWLCTESPAIMLPLFNPLCLSIDAATSTFSPPLSDRTLEGHPFLSTAASKSACTVAARLFVEQLKYTMSLEKPSIPMYHKPPTDEAMRSINVPKRIRSPDTVNMPSDCVKPSQIPSNRINSNHTWPNMLTLDKNISAVQVSQHHADSLIWKPFLISPTNSSNSTSERGYNG